MYNKNQENYVHIRQYIHDLIRTNNITRKRATFKWELRDEETINKKCFCFFY